MAIKKCGQCRQKKETSEFYKLKSGKFGVAGCCKKCQEAKKKGTAQTYRSSPRGRHILYINYVKSEYGISEEDLQDLMDVQNGCCAICGQDFGTLKPRYHIDHNHKTGEVRGLLCPYCNTGLGFIESNDGILDKVTKYLGGN